jgi:cytohesin
MTYKTVDGAPKASPRSNLADESKIPDDEDYRLIAENDEDGDYWRVRQWARPGARSEAWARKLDDAAAALARTSARTSAALAEALCDAAARGDAWRLDALLARGGGAALQKECRNYEGRTPAHLAASHGRVDVLELLHRRGLSLSATDAFGGTPLLSAATRAPRATAAATIAFLRDRAGPLACDNLGELLSQKATDNESDALARLLAAGADPNARDSHGKAALHAAAVAGHPTTLLALLDAGADVDARDARQRTPLAHATYRRRLDCLRILLSRGADPNALDEDGASVVDIALKAGSDDCASELIKAGGSASSADDGGAARLRAAACAGDACLIERLIKAGLRPDACADDGRTALHLAAGEGASRVAAKLVELGADVKKADRQGRSALEIACAAGYYDLEARLRLLSES